MDLTYAGGSLALDMRDAPGRVAAGDRAPDAPLPGRRLFEAMAGPHWTLVGCGIGRTRIRPRPDVVFLATDDALADGVADTYDARPGTWILIRPDGYVGAIASAGQENALDTYLDRVMPMDAERTATVGRRP